MKYHGTYVSTRTQIDQLVRSLRPLRAAGVLRTGGWTESVHRLGAVRRWGISLAALVEMGAADFPGRVALIDDAGSLSYAMLRKQAIALAKSLRGRRTAEGRDLESLTIVARNGRGLILPMIAATYLGIGVKLLNPGCSATQLRNTMGEYPSDALFVDAEFAELAELAELPERGGAAPADHTFLTAEWSGDTTGRATLASLIDEGRTTFRHVELPARPVQQPTVIMSSGTRGVPKAVVLPVPRTPKPLGGILDAVPARSGDVIQLHVGIFHAWGWCNLQLALATGSTLIARRCFDPDTEAGDLARYGVSGIISAAVFLRDLLATVDERGLDASAVRYVVTAGSTIPPTLVNALNERFGDGRGVVCNFYGSTEHGQISIGRIEDLLDDPTTAGRPVMGVRLAIIGEDGAPVPQGETGTIYSSNSMTSLGFLSDKDSADVIDGMLSTGDTGFIDEAGRLYVCGRADDMVIRGGENVHPRTIEEFLLTLPEVRDAFVIGHQEDIVATLDASVVLNADISDDAINELVLTNVNEFSGLDHIVRVGALPRNESGKVVPRLLPQT